MPEDLIPIRTALVSVDNKKAKDFSAALDALFSYNGNLELYATPGTADHITNELKLKVKEVVKGYYLYRNDLVYTLKNKTTLGFGKVDKRLDAVIIGLSSFEELDKSGLVPREKSIEEVSKSIDRGGIGLITSGLSDYSTTVIADPSLYKDFGMGVLKQKGKTSSIARMMYASSLNSIKSYLARLNNYYLKRFELLQGKENEDLIKIDAVLVSVHNKENRYLHDLLKSLFYHNKKLQLFATPGTADHIQKKLKLKVKEVVGGYGAYRDNLIYTLKDGTNLGVGNVNTKLDAIIVDLYPTKEDGNEDISVDRGGIGLLLGGITDPRTIVVAETKLYGNLETILTKNKVKTSSYNRIWYAYRAADVVNLHVRELINRRIEKFEEFKN